MNYRMSSITPYLDPEKPYPINIKHKPQTEKYWS